MRSERWTTLEYILHKVTWVLGPWAILLKVDYVVLDDKMVCVNNYLSDLIELAEFSYEIVTDKSSIWPLCTSRVMLWQSLRIQSKGPAASPHSWIFWGFVAGDPSFHQKLEAVSISCCTKLEFQTQTNFSLKKTPKSMVDLLLGLDVRELENGWMKMHENDRSPKPRPLPTLPIDGIEVSLFQSHPIRIIVCWMHPWPGWEIKNFKTRTQKHVLFKIVLYI